MTTGVGEPRSKRVIGEGLSTHRNSLNFLRLVLASIVLVSHAAGLAHFRRAAMIVNGTSAAQLSLYGFFAISGYLIAQSAMRTRPMGYLWRRCLRIFPGLIVCTLVTAFGIGLLAWWWTAKPGCSLGCYFGATDSPTMYVVKNSLLANPYWTQYTIAGLPNFSDYPGFWTWNASIWTLFYEFLCYLLLLAMSLVGMLRSRLSSLVAFAVLWGAIITIELTASLDKQFNFFHFSVFESILRFSLIFLAGSILFLYRDRVPDSGWLALASGLIFSVGVLLPIDGRVPTLEFTSIDLYLPFLAYPVLWLGLHLPFRSVGAKNDYSYGIYIYGWPVAQLLIMWHLPRFGSEIFLLMTLGFTVPLAIASWWLVERRSLRLKSLHLRRSGDRTPATSRSDESSADRRSNHDEGFDER